VILLTTGKCSDKNTFAIPVKFSSFFCNPTWHVFSSLVDVCILKLTSHPALFRFAYRVYPSWIIMWNFGSCQPKGYSGHMKLSAFVSCIHIAAKESNGWTK